MDVAAYARQLKQLLPRGAAWNLEADSVLTKLLLAFSEELARVDGRAQTLLQEVDPRTTLEMLADWEAMLDLPDDCITTIPVTVAERRIAVVRRLVSRGGASRQYFLDLAAASGFSATITEYVGKVARVGRFRMGDRLYGTAWAYVWQLNISLSSPALTGWTAQSVFFRTGSGRAGDRLRSWNGPDFECIVRDAKPAHTIVLFSYA